jgi:hypothetical protein
LLAIQGFRSGTFSGVPTSSRPLSVPASRARRIQREARGLGCAGAGSVADRMPPAHNYAAQHGCARRVPG